MNLLSSALETLVKNDEAKINIQPVIRHTSTCKSKGCLTCADRSSADECATRSLPFCVTALLSYK